MRLHFRRPTALAGYVLVLAALVGSRTALMAAAPAPAKPDSRLSIKPKEVTLTASVEPTEAKPGAIVTYQVTAKLQPGWHIYKYDKTPGAAGPKNTTFDFFDTGGLKIVGEWSASKPP